MKRSGEATIPMVGEMLVRLGESLAVARKRRRITIKDAAARLNVSRNTVASAERGEPGVGVGVVMGLLWLYGLDRQVVEQLEPARDVIGASLEASAASRMGRSEVFDGEF